MEQLRTYQTEVTNIPSFRNIFKYFCLFRLGNRLPITNSDDEHHNTLFTNLGLLLLNQMKKPLVKPYRTMPTSENRNWIQEMKTCFQSQNLLLNLWARNRISMGTRKKKKKKTNGTDTAGSCSKAGDPGAGGERHWCFVRDGVFECSLMIQYISSNGED